MYGYAALSFGIAMALVLAGTAAMLLHRLKANERPD